MSTAIVSPQYTVKIPASLRSQLRVGQRVAVHLDAQGRLVLTPIEKAHAILDETFGAWSNRTDIPRSGIQYMDKVRRGRRLKELGLPGRK
jgi:hypothetical protein